MHGGCYGFALSHRANGEPVDSDMHQYAQASSGVYKVSNLRELANAVDAILTDG